MCQNNCADLMQKLDYKQNTPERRLTSQDLLAGARELFIEHEGCCYCLRLTRQNKLILTK